MISNLLGDLRAGIRSFVREPGYALAFTLTLGLGIGANSAIFTIVNGVLLQPLPYPDAERIVYLQQPAMLRGGDNAGFSFTELADYRAQAQSLEEIVEFGDWTFVVQGRGDPHRAAAGLVTANFFEVLGMRARAGRLLTAEDRQRDAPPVVVLTHEYWQRVFGGDRTVVGETIDLTEKRATIVGVLEPGSHYASIRTQELYANYTSNDHYNSAAMREQRVHRMTQAFARLAPGVSVTAATADLERVAALLRQQHPDAYPEGWGLTITATPWKEELVRQARPTLLVLLATAVFVLLIACANVANLTLARQLRRAGELAVRAALGASRRRLRRLVFVESLVLALAGAALGVVGAFLLLDLLVAYTSRFTQRTGEISIDVTVLAFTVLIATGCALAFALEPGMLRQRRLDSAVSGGRSTASRERRGMQRLLVVGQVALSFVLLIGTGLLLRTLANLHAVDLGFDLDNVLSLEAPLVGRADPAEIRRFTDEALRQVVAHPGVHAAAVASDAPLGGTQAYPMAVRAQGRAPESEAAIPTVFGYVSTDYFRTIGTGILRGRAFADSDGADAEPVAIVNQSMARHYFGDDPAIGERISYTFSTRYGPWLTIVGIAADARFTGVDAEGVHALYLPEAQGFAPSTLLVRTEGDPAAVAPDIVATVRQLDPARPIERVRTLAELRDESVAPWRLNATLFATFAALALLIAAVGVAAVIAFSVSRRRREFGIRAALGAEPRRLVRQVLGEGVALIVAGLIMGALAAVPLSRFLQGLLFEVPALDAASYGISALVLCLVAIVACVVPARRAARAEPAQVLRAE